MKKYLSFDPGFITGIALSNTHDVEITMTVTREMVLSNGFLSKLVAMTKPDVVLVEGIPAFMPHPAIVELKAEIVRWFRIAGYEVHEIQPSQWKGFVKRVVIPGQHARDAASMCRWWVENNERQ